MKYVLALITTFFLCFDVTSSNLCWFFENNNNPRLTRRTISHNATCSCECWQYQPTRGTNNQYKCGNCNHRLSMPDPLSASNITIVKYNPTTQKTTLEKNSNKFAKGPQFIRYNETQEETNVDRALEINNYKELPAARDLQHPLRQQWREKTFWGDLRYVDQRRSD